MSTVLVVDDEADIRLLCRLTLESSGHDVVQVDTAEAALRMLRQIVADYVLLDIRMPGMSGWELLDLMRADPVLRELKVIIFSAHAGPSEERRAAIDGVYGFLAKPFLPADLRQIVEAPGDARQADQVVLDPPCAGRMRS